MMLIVLCYLDACGSCRYADIVPAYKDFTDDILMLVMILQEIV